MSPDRPNTWEGQMTVTNDNKIELLLNEAEEHGQCLVRPHNAHLMRALAYRANHAKRNPIYSPYRGIYVRQAYWNGLSRTEQVTHMAKALSQIHPEWVFDGYTAAAIRGWNVSYSLLDRLSIVAPYQVQSKSIIARSSKHITHEILHGIRVTTVAQTLHQCLRAGDLRTSLPIADSALRVTGKTSSSLIELLENDPAIVRQHDLQRAVDVLSPADARSESGGESIARATMIMLGFAVPDLQIECHDPMNPSKVIRVDFYWTLSDGTVIIGELDGKQKYVDPAMTKGKDLVRILSDERLRESRLSINGARIVRFSFDDVCNVAYFAQLLESYGVPRDTSEMFVTTRWSLCPRAPSAKRCLRSNAMQTLLPPMSIEDRRSKSQLGQIWDVSSMPTRARGVSTRGKHLGANGTRLNACGKHLGAIETMASTRSERPSLERLA